MNLCGHMNINNTLWFSGTAAQQEGLILTLAKPRRWEEHMPMSPWGVKGAWQSLVWGLVPRQTLDTRAVKKGLNVVPQFLALRAVLAAIQAEVPSPQALQQ